MSAEYPTEKMNSPSSTVTRGGIVVRDVVRVIARHVLGEARFRPSRGDDRAAQVPAAVPVVVAIVVALLPDRAVLVGHELPRDCTRNWTASSS